MLVYATTTDLTSWITPLPTNAPALLRSASLRVREATKTAVYAVDGDDLPTDPVVLQAFKDATCAHAAALSTAGVNPGTGGLVTTASTATSKSVGSASVAYSGAAAAATAKQMLAATLCPDAVAILAQAGIIPAAPWTVG